jgi:hypothetical protein
MSRQWPPDWDDPDEVFPAAADEAEPEARARLSEVTAFLAAVPVPVIPDGVEARISAALAAEASARAAQAGDSRADAPGGASALRSRRLARGPVRTRVRRPGLHRSLLVAAPLVVCLLFAGLGLLLSRGGGAQSSSASAGSAAVPASAASSAASSGVAPPSAASGGVAPSSGAAGSERSAASAAEAPVFSVTRSGVVYRRATLASQVAAVLAAAPGPSAGNVSSAPSAQLRSCVLRLTGGTAPRLVDEASYQGTAAYIIASPSQVWVVGLGCSAANPELIVSVPRAGLPGNLRALVSV